MTVVLTSGDTEYRFGSCALIVDQLGIAWAIASDAYTLESDWKALCGLMDRQGILLSTDSPVDSLGFWDCYSGITDQPDRRATA